jgi:hypothetical protein
MFHEMAEAKEPSHYLFVLGYTVLQHRILIKKGCYRVVFCCVSHPVPQLIESKVTPRPWEMGKVGRLGVDNDVDYRGGKRPQTI